MNVLVLTPDRVGSSLLQKFITVNMQNEKYEYPVINLHELTNGIENYYSNIFQSNMLGKPKKENWGYYQKLEEIQTLLESTNHFKISRLAHYHLINRKDNLLETQRFYKYLNDNFYIISARRENIFEHALSWCIVKSSNRLNLYTHEEKIHVIKRLYKNKINIDQNLFEDYLTKYVNYLKWVEENFNIQSTFNYEYDVKDLEKYVESIGIKSSWKETFNISWNDWNKCHYLISDTSDLSLSNSIELQDLSNTTCKLTQSMSLDDLITRSSMSLSNQSFLSNNITNYIKVYKELSSLIQKRILLDGIPIKLQTLSEKARLITNLEECINTFNNWSSAQKRNYYVSIEDLKENALNENKFWYN